MIYEGVAPIRIDLAGGTLDLWPVHCLFSECHTINLGIPLFTRATVQSVSAGGGQKPMISVKSKDLNIEAHAQSFEELLSPDFPLPLAALAVESVYHDSFPSLDITLKSDSPAGAGLGGSSSLLISLLSALYESKGISIDEHQLVRNAMAIEARLIHSPSGCQDFWGAVRGGLSTITFRGGDVNVQTSYGSLDNDFKESLILVGTGETRQSAVNNWEVFTSVFSKDSKMLEGIGAIAQNSVEFAYKLHDPSAQPKKDPQKRLEEFLPFIKRDWQIRCEMWPGIETKRAKEISECAYKNGAYFSKLCGAGGGGVVAVLAPKKDHKKIIASVKKISAEVFECNGPQIGLKTVKY